ncbi:MAG TPA: shikimate dehydrogenase [Armatimonadota bacterium]|jgi:shikimate dehydrogenase
MRSITGTTTVVGVFGHPVEHSLSPAMHNAAFAAQGLDWVYVPFAVRPDALEAALAGAVALNMRGMNVTIPHKQAVLPLLDRLTPDAEAIGSVNTILISAAGTLGHSTDGPGFLRALRERGFPLAGAQVVILGSGGASRAVVGALATAGVAAMTIVARRPERGMGLVVLAKQRAPRAIEVAVIPWDDGAQAAIAHAQLLVNATSVGMAPHDVGSSPVPQEWLHARLWVYDLVYTPRPTALLSAAVAQGCTTIDGVAMLVYQGAEAYTLWTGQPAPVKVMEAAVTAHLSGA